MTNHVGAQLSALSIPGQGNLLGPYYPPYGAGPGYWYMSGPSFRERPYGRVFFGAEDPSALPQRSGLLAEVAPLVAPGTGGVLVRKHLDDKQVLHVEICVDGMCHSTSMDLAPAISMLLGKLKSVHDQWHASQAAPDTVVSTVESAVDDAQEMIVGALVARHIDVMTSGWLSDVGGAIGGTLRKLGPVIAVVATAAATAYGGPVAGAAAAKLAPVITNLQANALDPKGNPKKKAAAQAALQQLNEEAKTDPVKAQALAAATQAVKNTAIAYHVQDTAERASAGDPAAKKDIKGLVAAAEQGDPAAQSTFEVLAATFAQEAMKSEEGAKLWQQITGRGPGTISSTPTSAGWYDMVGAQAQIGGFWSSAKNALLTVTLTKATNQFIKDNHLEPYVKLAATAVATAYGGPAAGAAAGALAPYVMNLGVKDKKEAVTAEKYVATIKADARTQGPAAAAAAEVAQAAIEQTVTTYQMSQLVKDAKAGNPEAQQSLAKLRALAAQGDPDAVQAVKLADAIDREQNMTAGGPPGGPAGYPPGGPAGYPPGGPPQGPQQSFEGPAAPIGRWHEIANIVIGCGGMQRGQVRQHYGYMGPQDVQSVIGQWHEIIGAAIDDLREKARAHAYTKPGNAAGVLMTPDGRQMGRGFRTLDAAIDWLQHITRNHRSFTYAAAYEKDAAGKAYIQAEEFGNASPPAQMALK